MFIDIHACNYCPDEDIDLMLDFKVLLEKKKTSQQKNLRDYQKVFILVS